MPLRENLTYQSGNALIRTALTILRNLGPFRILESFGASGNALKKVAVAKLLCEISLTIGVKCLFHFLRR